MVSRREFEELHLDQRGLLNRLASPLEDQVDIPQWHEKLAHVERQIPAFTKQDMEGAGEGFKGITTVDGISWSWWIIKEAFQLPHQYIDTRGKVTAQKDWAFLSFSTPLRTPEEITKAREFAQQYGRALQCVLIQRAYDARSQFGLRR